MRTTLLATLWPISFSNSKRPIRIQDLEAFSVQAHTEEILFGNGSGTELRGVVVDGLLELVRGGLQNISNLWAPRAVQ